MSTEDALSKPLGAIPHHRIIFAKLPGIWRFTLHASMNAGSTMNACSRKSAISMEAGLLPVSLAPSRAPPVQVAGKSLEPSSDWRRVPPVEKRLLWSVGANAYAALTEGSANDKKCNEPVWAIEPCALQSIFFCCRTPSAIELAVAGGGKRDRLAHNSFALVRCGVGKPSTA